MTVYVDDMHKVPMGSVGRMKMSHMIADTGVELHEMADKIGVARKWFQGDHYDIALSKRGLAVKYGAVEITMRQLGVIVMNRRKAKAMCIKNGTKQCAAICLSHSCLITLGECPSLLEVWTPDAIAARMNPKSDKFHDLFRRL